MATPPSPPYSSGWLFFFSGADRNAINGCDPLQRSESFSGTPGLDLHSTTGTAHEKSFSEWTSVLEVLNGTKINSIPVGRPSDGRLILNRKIANAGNFRFPK